MGVHVDQPGNPSACQKEVTAAASEWPPGSASIAMPAPARRRLIVVGHASSLAVPVRRPVPGQLAAAQGRQVNDGHGLRRSMAMPAAARFNARRVGTETPHGRLVARRNQPKNKGVPAANRVLALFARAVFTLARYLYHRGNQIDRRCRPNSPWPWPARWPAPGRAAGAGSRSAGRRQADRPATVTTDRRRGASSQCAHRAARGAGQPPFRVARARPADLERTVPSRPSALTEAQAGRIVTRAAPQCMITETWASQPRRPSYPRRFVVIYRSRQPEGHGRHGRILVDVMIFPVSQALRQSHRAAAWR